MSTLLNLPLLVQHLPGIVVALSPDAEFRMLAVSDRHLEATMTRREETIGKPLFDVFPDDVVGESKGDGMAALRASLLRVLRTHEPEVLPVLRYDILRPDRSFEARYWKPSNTPVFDVEGRLTYILHFAEDVSDQYRVEQNLKASDLRYRQILDSAKDYAIISFDLAGLITTWNDGAVNVLGWTEEEMLGQPSCRFFTPEDNAQHRPEIEMRCALETGFATDERWHIRKDDQRFWASGELTPLRDEKGRVQGFVKILRDRTEHERLSNERNAAVHDLRELTENLKQRVAEESAHRDRIWQLSTDLIDVCDGNGQLLSVNKAWTTMLGWSEEMLLQTNFLDLVHPDDRTATRDELQRLESGKSTLRFENRFRCEDGSYRIISWVAQPYEHRFYATGRDVTEHRTVEEQLRQSQKMEAIGQLTGGIAHDFNNLLATIISSLELMHRKLASGSGTAGLERYVGMASTSAQRAASLIQRLLAFSRKQTLDLQQVDLNALVTDMEELLRRTLGESTQLSFSLQPGLCTVISDRNQLESALLNLCINARDAMERGGLLTIATNEVELDTSYTRLQPHLKPGPHLKLSVTDTGSGMSPEVAAKAFDPFFTTKPIGKGTGLGLSMIYGFARQTGGHISIHSIAGQGTTVNLYLPCGAEEKKGERSGAYPGKVPPLGTGETILFVEDEPGVRAILGEVLAELDYTTHEAVDGPSALAVLESLNHLDLLITDVGLPGMSGRQLAEIAREKRPLLKVLFITGYAHQASVRAEFLGPGMDMMAKPFTIDTLAHKVREMLSHSAH